MLLLQKCLAWGLLIAVAVTATRLDSLERDEIIEAVNSAKTTWKAGRNFDTVLKKSYVKNLLGVKKRQGNSLLPNYIPKKITDVPENFDARTKWTECTSLQEIRDQGPCGSDWAVAATSVFSDRLCILTNASFNQQLSAENLLACCTDCGFGCGGGYTDPAWLFLLDTGVPTGSGYHSHQGCQPYTLPTCKHNSTSSENRKDCSSYGYVSTPKCKYSCYNKQYKKHKFFADRHTVNHAFLMNNQTGEMQQEIFTNGPLEATFTLYEDFLSYKSGVYQYTAGDELGVHAVKLLGWGVEENVPYWLAANSWNSNWGDKGYFKILRNNNECLIEQEVTGGTPNIKHIY